MTSKPRILIVEDDVLIALDLAEQLADIGYEPVSVSSADTGLSLIADADFAGLVTDVELPGQLSGLDLARQAATLRPALPIVVVSGNVRPGPAALPTGARFVAKPYAITSITAGLTHPTPRRAA